MQACWVILDLHETKPSLLVRGITGDELWTFEYTMETKHQKLQLKTQMYPRQKKARWSTSEIKAKLIANFDMREIVHCNFCLRTRQLFQQHVYIELLTAFASFRVWEEARDVGKQFVAAWPWPLTCTWCAELLVTPVKGNIAKQPIYLPGLALCDRFIFSGLEEPINRNCFAGNEGIKRGLTTEVRRAQEESLIGVHARVIQKTWNCCKHLNNQ